MPEIKVDDEVWETVSDDLRIAVSYLLKVRDRLGLTDETKLEGTKENSSTKNKVVLRYALEVYRVWAGLYPQEHHQFIEDTKHELAYERSVQDAVKAGGYSPASFPMRLDRLYGILLPGIKIQDKRFWKPMFGSIPELKRSNYA